MNPISYIKSHGIKGTWDVIYRYKIDQQLKRIAIKITKNKPLQNTIVIESHNDFDSNGGAFYEYLLKNHYNDKYKIVWLLKNEKPTEMPKNVEAFCLYKPSLKKQKEICTAKYILTCQDVIGSVRDGQTSVYLTHGPFGLKAIKGKINLPQNLTYCLMPSKYLENILKDQYQIGNTNIKPVILGYPIHDLLYVPSEKELSKITDAHYDKVILWMPTFRKGKAFGRNDSNFDEPLGIPIFYDIDALSKLNQKLKIKNTLLIIKIHPMQDKKTIKVEDMSNVKVLDGDSVRKLNVDNYRLMKDADALISDYSSAAYDYLHLDRPIGFTVDDAKEYKLGFIVNPPEQLMGGQVITNQLDFINFIDSVLKNEDPYKNKRHKIFDKVFKFHDGNSCQRLANFLKL